MVKNMKPGAVIVDVAIDQGGCCETPSQRRMPSPLTLSTMSFITGGEYAGGVPRTSTFALNNVTLPHILNLADNGYKAALSTDPHLKAGLNVAYGKVTCEEVAHALELEFTSPDEILA